MKAVYTQSALANTTTITNIGNIKVEPEYEPYITGFYSFIPMSRTAYEGHHMLLQGHAGVYFLIYSGRYDDSEKLFKKLVNDGVEVTIETNGEYYD